MGTPCTPLNACTNLDGLVVVQRTIYGPLLGFDSQVTLPGINSPGSALRTYVDINFNLNWRSLGLCLGPVTSIMGLAPGEVVTVGLRSRQSRSFFEMMQSASQSSQSSTSNTQQTIQPAPPGQSSGTKSNQSGGSQNTLLALAPLFIALFGSNMSDGSSVGIDYTDSSSDNPSDQAALDIGNVMTQIALTPDTGVLQQAVSVTTQILDTVSQSESQSQLQESTVTTTDETEFTVQRVFGNPYLDRSLELRFIPVFNQYEVTISLGSVGPGLVGFFGEPTTGLRAAATTAATASPGINLADEIVPGRPAASLLAFLQATGNSDNAHRPMINLVRSVTARSDHSKGVRLDQGLAWDRAAIRGNGLHVPLSDFADLAAAWKLTGATADNLKTNLNKTNPKVVGGIMKPQKQTVSIFAGTHIEAVPGTCVLPDIPDHLKVVVPGAKEVVKSTE